MVKVTVSPVLPPRLLLLLTIVAVIGVGKIGETFEFDLISLLTIAPEASVVYDTKFPVNGWT